MRRRLLIALLATAALAACSPPGDHSNSSDAHTSDPPAAPAGMAAVTTAANNSATTADGTENCQLRMGWDPWEPYQYRNIDGDVRGVDVDLVRAILENAGCTLVTEEGRWAGLVSRLQEGSIDLLAGATRTKARESYARFSRPYRSEDFELFVRRDDVNRYSFDSLQSLLEKGFRVGVTEGYVYGKQVEELQADPAFADQFISATVGELNYERLLDTTIDGFLEDPFVVARAVRRRGMDKNILAHPLVVHSGEVNLMFSRVSVNQKLIERIDDSLAELRADGRYDEIVNKYR